VFFVSVGPGGVGFACLLLRCVREPRFPWVSCARRVVCSGAVRAFLLRCLRRSFVRWCLLACASGVWRLWFCRAGCPPFGACPGVRRWASPVALLVRSCSALASSVWSLLPCVPCRLAFGLWWFACPGAQRFAVGSVRSGVSLPSSAGGFAGRSVRPCLGHSWFPSVPGGAVLRQLLCRRLATGAGVLWGGLVPWRLRSRPPSLSVLLAAAGVVDGGLASL
jgi:hypothetical protein